MLSRNSISFLFLSAWCGLVAGLLEVSTIVLRKSLFDSNHLYGMSRHFIWLVPVTNVCVFMVLGALGSAVLAWGHRGRWLASRGLCAVTLLPTFLVALPQIFGLAWLVVALGVATRIAPLFERHDRDFRRFVLVSFPIAAGLVLTLGASVWIGDRARQSRENARALPPAGSPNVLLIVMDTIAAGHLSLHGYNRPTSTTLADWAEHGARFDFAQAAAPWTLPSHAAMFTGRWMHELGVGWLTPLDNTYPTLAAYLGSKGYATAGFVANTSYCASDSGLDRGFTQYHDFIFPKLTACKKTTLVNRALLGIYAIVTFLEDQFGLTQVRAHVQKRWLWFDNDRKPASMVNRELLDWLSQRGQLERPFFAFLNYFDAHFPYQLPTGNYYRFGGKPADTRQRAMIERWGELDKTPLTPQELAFGASAYDDCIADLDEQIGILLDKLRRKGMLDRTWLIIAADHGESFGEHTGIFCHGTSLYQSELHVPLLIIPPGGTGAKQVVKEAVSLRDLAATIADVAGQKAGSPFPGQSLARFWDGTKPTLPTKPASLESAFAEVVPNPNAPGNHDSSGVPKPNWPLGALKDAEWSYIRREGEVREELFHLREDATEQHNGAANPAASSALERMRRTLNQVTNGPLLPPRFSP
jgi:arylsulfatase A-like enzyme